jgi:hypothetical protein
MLNYLQRRGKISQETMHETIEFLKKHSYEASLQTESTNGNGVH